MHAFTAFSVLLCSFARIFTLSQEKYIYIYVALLQKFDRCIVVIPCSFKKKCSFRLFCSDFNKDFVCPGSTLHYHGYSVDKSHS